jgi:RHS repeat-associated protein
LEDRYEYDAFGKPYIGDLSQGMDLGYTGKPYDVATGMYNYGYRDYTPELARFTTVDPIRDGSNWFAYVNNDPVNWVDPDGREVIPLVGIHTITGEFGSNPGNMGRKSDADIHAGVDLTSTTRAVQATKSGEVAFAGKHPDGIDVATGTLIIIKYDDGNYGLYGHMDPEDLSVKKGDKVTEGEGLGKYFDGSMGTSTGAHLHYQEYQLVDPPSDANDLARLLNGTGYFYDQSSVPEDKKAINSSGKSIQVVAPAWSNYNK